MKTAGRILWIIALAFPICIGFLFSLFKDGVELGKEFYDDLENWLDNRR